ncbi:MAG: PAS domain S-box protein [Candidatus Thiodiazotropha sp.]
MPQRPKNANRETSGDANLISHYYESLDLINRAIQGRDDLEEMICSVLDMVIAIFGCDRAFLLYPCDPGVADWRLSKQRTRPESPMIRDLTVMMPKDEGVAVLLQLLLEHSGPLTFGVGNEFQAENAAFESNGAKSSMAMALQLKGGKAWQFTIQQCSRGRVWTAGEIELFKETGRRLGDGLSLLTAFSELKKNEENYSRIVNLANEGIWVLDAKGKTSFANARMAEMLGYTAEEMQGRPVTDFMFEDEVQDYVEKLNSSFKNVTVPYERKYRRKDGETLWVMVSATGILDEEGKFVGGFGMVSDVTAKRQAEADLRHLNEELEARVIERTGELQASHVELEKAYEELKRAHASILQQEKMASIGQLASGIAHEINTPTQYVSNNISFLRESMDGLLSGMQTCLGAVSSAQNGSLTREALGELEAVLEETDFDYLKTEIPRALEESTEGIRRITSIVVAMKEFAHPSGDNLELVDLENLIQNTVEISRNSWKSVADLSIEPAATPLRVYGRRDELGQVLLNLIINAVDAIEEPHKAGEALGRIRIQSRDVGGWAEIRVEDTGCGIPLELRHKIFEPFFTTKEVGKGSGQGLAIAYHIIKDKHGGELLVDSASDRGTTLTIRLPMARQDSEVVRPGAG